jgi:hypothetical protein
VTTPAPETLDREKDKLFLTDAEMIGRLGVPQRLLRPFLPALESNYGFPQNPPSLGIGDTGGYPVLRADGKPP